ncbi:MAG: hypothetical protein EPO24_13700 [Bacteroidetes bacterium]|nr:MAG: hypothetical protein EPO24_13700 [Bacteroidota bacterium]
MKFLKTVFKGKNFFASNVIRDEHGQILLIVILTMIVALTVGLSIASRTITNLKISKQNEESNRAFQAAEAGIEKALRSGATSSQSNTLSNSSAFKTTIITAQGTAFVLNGGDSVDQDAGIDLWLSNYPNYSSQIAAANITVYWGTTGQNTCAKGSTTAIMPAIEILALTGATTSPTLTKKIYEATGSGCPRIPGATTAAVVGSQPIPGQNFNNSATISITNGIIMKIVPLFNSSVIGVTSNVALPPQGSSIDSTGTSGDTVRRVIYNQSYPQVPLELFPYTLVSQ